MECCKEGPDEVRRSLHIRLYETKTDQMRGIRAAHLSFVRLGLCMVDIIILVCCNAE